MKKSVIIYRNGIQINVDLEIKECDIDYSWNVNNCKCEMKKATKFIVEECKEISDDVKENDFITENKTVTLIKRVKDCKPFIVVKVLFFCISVILIGIMICFCLKSKKKFT